MTRQPLPKVFPKRNEAQDVTELGEQGNPGRSEGSSVCRPLLPRGLAPESWARVRPGVRADAVWG